MDNYLNNKFNFYVEGGFKTIAITLFSTIIKQLKYIVWHG